MGFAHSLLLFILAATSSVLGFGFPAGRESMPAMSQEQSISPPGTIRVRVRLVPVDVIVTDSHDRPVVDLKQQDFQVFENGREQEIRHFTVQNFTNAPPDPGQKLTLKPVSALELAPQPARTFLILMGRGRHQRPLKAVDALVRFVRQDLLPRDQVAVYAYNRATNFTTDHEQIAQVLERYKVSNDKIESWLESRLRGLAGIYGMKEIPKSFQPEIDRIFRSDDSLASRQVPPGRMTEKGTLIRDWDRAAGTILANSDRATEADFRKAVADEEASSGAVGAGVMQSMIAFDTLVGQFATLELPFDEFAPRAAGSFLDMQDIYTSIEYLRYVEGEKHLLFFTGDGLLFPFGDVSYDHGIAAVANDARVAIDVFQTSGTFADPELVPTKGVTLQAPARVGSTTAPPPPNVSPTGWSRSFMLSVLRSLAHYTGGRVAIHEDIGKALDIVNESTRCEYLLGYYPDDAVWDGKYRQINVKVKRPGLKVSFRQGYFAKDKLQPYDRAEFLAYSRITAAGAYESDVSDIPFKVVTTKITNSPGQAQLKVDLQVDAGKVGFRTANGRHTGKLRIAVFYSNGAGKYLGQDWKTLDLQLQEANFERVMNSGLPYSVLLPLRSSEMRLKVIVYDMGSDRVGSRLVTAR